MTAPSPRDATATPGATAAPPPARRDAGAEGPLTAALLTLAFALLLALGMVHHAMWRDELQAWLLARGATSPLDLLHTMRYEGHPALWHLLLLPLAHATADPRAMQALHLLLAAAGVFLFVRWAPFPLWLRALFAFGYVPLFEFGIISRNYALALPLLWWVCRLWPHRRGAPLPLALALALLANANPYAWMLAGSVAATLALEFATAARPRRALAARPGVALAAGLVVVGGLGVAAWQMVPPPDANLGTAFLHWWPPRLYRALGTALAGYLPLPDPATATPWNSALVYRLPVSLLVPIAVLWLTVALASLLWARSAWRLYLLGTLALLAFTYTHYVGWERHHVHHLLLFVACCWLADDGEGPARRWREGLLAAALCVHLATAAWLFALTLERPFSDAAVVAARVVAPPLAGLPVVGYPDPPLTAVAAYLGGPITSLARGEPMTYLLWRHGSDPHLPRKEYCAALAAQAATHPGGVAFVTQPSTPPTACPGLLATPIGTAPRTIVPSERLQAWRVSPGPP